MLTSIESPGLQSHRYCNGEGEHLQMSIVGGSSAWSSNAEGTRHASAAADSEAKLLVLRFLIDTILYTQPNVGLISNASVRVCEIVTCARTDTQILFREHPTTFMDSFMGDSGRPKQLCGGFVMARHSRQNHARIGLLASLGLPGNLHVGHLAWCTWN